jgi:phospholipase C
MTRSSYFRFATVDRARRGAATAALATLTIALAVPARADNDLEDLTRLTDRPATAAAIQQLGHVPLSTNVLGYDPCDDPVADRARLSGCAANGKIEHVIYVVLENHSFDNYFGRLNVGELRVPGADVSTPANTVPQSLGTRAAKDYRFPLQPFHLTEYCGWSDLGHQWAQIHTQTNGNRLNGYLVGSSTTSPALGQFEEPDLAYYYALAKTFAIGDRIFASTATQSYPNHYYAVSGTSAGFIDNSSQDAETPSADPATGDVALGTTGNQWRTIFDGLEENGISWKIYVTNLSIAMTFDNFAKWAATGHATSAAQFFADLDAGTLPQVAIIYPGTLYTDEHPGTGNHQRGQLQNSIVLDALLTSSAWPTSVLFNTYDDSGGWYDHVPPPRAYQPDDRCAASPRANAANCVNGTWAPGSNAGTAPALAVDKRFGDHFDQLGARLPFTIVSPWVKKPTPGGGYATHHVYENATILSFIEWRFGLPSLNARTRAYKEGWRNPGCDWNVAKLRSAAPASAEAKALAWSAALADPFRTVRCAPCPASDPYCAVRDPGRDVAARAVVKNPSTGKLEPMKLAVAENRYLDPLLDPFDFSQRASTLLDGVAIAAGLPPLAETDPEEYAKCPATGGQRAALE